MVQILNFRTLEIRREEKRELDNPSDAGDRCSNLMPKSKRRKSVLVTQTRPPRMKRVQMESRTRLCKVAKPEENGLVYKSSSGFKRRVSERCLQREREFSVPVEMHTLQS